MPRGDWPCKEVSGRAHPIEKSTDRKGRPFLPLYHYWRISATKSKKAEGLKRVRREWGKKWGRKQPLQDQKTGLEDFTLA